MYEGFLFVIHLFLHTYCQLQVVSQCFINLIRWWRDSKWSADVLLSQVRHVTKIPGHVSLVFLEEDVPVEDIVKPIVWCICLGVTTISLYDYYGRLRNKKLDIDCELRDYYSDFTRSCKSLPKRPVSPKIQFISVENGRSDLVHAARDIISDLVAGNIKEITQTNFESYQKMFPGDHPDMLLKFGTHASLAGYPPWPAHLSEIISLPTCQMISPRDFVSSLERYSKIEKRVGK